MSMMFALIVTTCTFNHEYCVQKKVYYPTEEQCNVASAGVEARVAELRPTVRVVQFCIEQEAPRVGPAPASPPIVREVMESLRLP